MFVFLTSIFLASLCNMHIMTFLLYHVISRFYLLKHIDYLTYSL